jgi:hypothetical protein
MSDFRSPLPSPMPSMRQTVDGAPIDWASSLTRPPQDVRAGVAVEVGQARHLPGQGYAADAAHGALGQAVHQPDHVGPGLPVAPQDIGLGVGVEVAHPGHLPDGRHPADAAQAGPRRAVHQPDHVGPGGRVAPQDVGMVVAVEVARAGDLPVGTGRADAAQLAPLEPVYQPDQRGPARRVAPQDVRLAVGVEVGQGPDLPVRAGPADRARRLLHEAVHLPQQRGAGLAVAPQDVGASVGVEVAGGRQVVDIGRTGRAAPVVGPEGADGGHIAAERDRTSEAVADRPVARGDLDFLRPRRPAAPKHVDLADVEFEAGNAGAAQQHGPFVTADRDAASQLVRLGRVADRELGLLGPGLAAAQEDVGRPAADGLDLRVDRAGDRGVAADGDGPAQAIEAGGVAGR